MPGTAVTPGIRSLNGLSNDIQTFGFDLSGATPAWTSDPGTAVHTFAIPLAGDGITAGLISNAGQQIKGQKEFLDTVIVPSGAAAAPGLRVSDVSTTGIFGDEDHVGLSVEGEEFLRARNNPYSSVALFGGSNDFARLTVGNPSPGSTSATPGIEANYQIIIGDQITTSIGAGGNTSIATTGVGGVGAGVQLFSGRGGQASSAATSSTGGAGGPFEFGSGYGGSASVAGTGTNTGGAGGPLIGMGGHGGLASAATAGANQGGIGGVAHYSGGAGGAASGSGNANRTGGLGGEGRLLGGAGGAASGDGTGAKVGGIGGMSAVIAGTGGAASGAAGATTGGAGGIGYLLGGTGGTGATGGAGGNIIAQAGGGGVGTTQSGVGGTCTLVGGPGGAASVLDPSPVGGTAGDAIVRGGTGGAGAGATGTGGAGGNVYIDGGLGGAGTAGAGSGGAVLVRVASTTSFVEASRWTNAGHFGVGVTPTVRCHVKGATLPILCVEASVNTTSPAIEIRDAAGTQNRWMLYSGAGSATDGKFVIVDWRQSAVRIGIDTSGNVAIGSATPEAQLHCFGTSANMMLSAHSSGAPANPVGDRCRIYYRNGNIVFQILDGATTRYLSALMTGTGATWVKGTTAL